MVVATGKRFALGASRRLRDKADFERLLRHGERRSRDGYTFYLGRRQGEGARLGLLISRRHAARATDRNGIKRCIREAFRLERHNLGDLDMLVRPPYGVRASPQMLEHLRMILAGLVK